MYEDENGKFVVELLKDIRLDSTLTISSDATIVLNGYALSANGISAIEITDGDVVINGVENGSEIYVANAGSARAVLLSGGNAQLISGAYSITSANNTSCIGVSGGEMKIDGAVISANGASGNVRGIDIGAQGTAYIDNSDIKAFCTGANAYGINAYGKLTIDNSKVFVNGDTKTRALIVAKGATANASNSEFIGYTTILVKVTRSSQGISNSGKLTINDCYAYGNHSGISNAGELYIKGLNISEYEWGTYNNHQPKRDRKLLLQGRELDKLARATQDVGLTIVGLRLFINERGLAKVAIALCRGRKSFDKREYIKEKDAKREMDRARRVSL